MKIDIRNVKCCWINLDSATENKNMMIEQFEEIGLKNHERFSAREIKPPPQTPKTIYLFQLKIL